MPRSVLGRDEHMNLVDIEVTSDSGPIGNGDDGGGPHTHAEYAANLHVHDAPVHSHAYAAEEHGHAGFADSGHIHDTSHAHADYADAGHTHAAGSHPDLAAHTNLGLSAAHAHDFAVSGHNHDAAYSGTAHTHDLSHTHDLTGFTTDAEFTAHAASPHGGGEGVPSGVIAMWAGNVNQVPTGWLLCDGNNGTPDLTDRFIKGGTPGNTGGAATHQHTAHSETISHVHAVAVTDPGHAHVEQTNAATTGGLSGWPARDTSTNTASATGYSTQSATTGITASASAPAGSVAELTHDAVNHEPAYFTLAFIQKV